MFANHFKALLIVLFIAILFISSVHSVQSSDEDLDELLGGINPAYQEDNSAIDHINNLSKVKTVDFNNVDKQLDYINADAAEVQAPSKILSKAKPSQLKKAAAPVEEQIKALDTNGHIQNKAKIYTKPTEKKQDDRKAGNSNGVNPSSNVNESIAQKKVNSSSNNRAGRANQVDVSSITKNTPNTEKTEAKGKNTGIVPPHILEKLKSASSTELDKQELTQPKLSQTKQSILPGKKNADEAKDERRGPSLTPNSPKSTELTKEQENKKKVGGDIPKAARKTTTPDTKPPETVTSQLKSKSIGAEGYSAR
jgi:hypothetical protein